MSSQWLAVGAEADPLLERAERHVRELVAEHSALRNVATLVAREPTPEQVFAAVAEQVARVFAVPHVRLIRYEPEGSVVVGGFSEDDDEPFPIGSRWPLDSPGVTAAVRQTGCPARVEDYAPMSGEIAAVARGAGIRSAVASPIVVGRRLWGAIVVLSPRQEPFPVDTESRLTDFTELVATAIANADSRAALARLADEQAALRRVATIAARESSPVEVFGAVAEEAARVSETEAVGILRFGPDGTATLVAQSETPWDPPPLGTSFTLDGENLIAAVHRTGEAARNDDLSSATGSVAAMAHVLGVRSAVATPIVVEGSLWGTLIAATSKPEPLPEDTESRIREFTELVATAISNAESREALGLLADEQAALRRVAELVARGIKPEEVFRAVSAEVGVLFGSDLGEVIKFEDDETVTVFGATEAAGKRATPDPGYGVHQVRETGRSARFDSDDLSAAEIGPFVRSLGIRSGVASPIVLDGKLWGAITAVSLDRALAPGVEHRLNEFTVLIATAIANAESREALARLAAEQAALRRVAVLVAQGVPPADLFAAVIDELESLFHLDRDGTDIAGVVRFDSGPEFVAVGVSSGMDEVAGGTRWGPKDLYATTRVFRTGRSARVDADELAEAGGPDAEFLRRKGFLSQVASPIVVEGLLWGAVNVNSREPLAAGTEDRLERFGELVATAIANVEARDALAGLLDEQAALRRVATLVAKESSLADVLAGVGEEMANVLGEVEWGLARDDGDGMATALTPSRRAAVPAGTRIPIGADTAFGRAIIEGRTARIDDYFGGTGEMARIAQEQGIHAAVSCPIVVHGSTWGAMSVGWRKPEPLPRETETVVEGFSDLVATAIANSEARAEVERLAEEQAALRRVATLVADGAASDEIFASVAEEIARILTADRCAIGRFEPEDSMTVVAYWSSEEPKVPVGTRIGLHGDGVTAAVRESRRPILIHDHDAFSGPLMDYARSLGPLPRSTVAAPIFVESRVWGTIFASTMAVELKEGIESRVLDFAELIATAIANAESSAALAASRRRIVAASDETRRQIERNLHDGTQQRLVSLGLAVRAAEANVGPERQDVQDQLSRVANGLAAAIEDLQEISRGIHPAILSRGGLGPALQTLAHRSAIPVDLSITTDVRLAEPIEVAAYFVASEALANAAKHSEAARIDVSLEQRDDNLLLSVRDDGVGGADAARGSGIVGLHDRVEALGGSLRVDSRPGDGTQIVARLPLDLELERPV